MADINHAQVIINTTASSENNDDPTDLTSLPNELVCFIMQYLPAGCLISFSQTSARMRALVDERSTALSKKINDREITRLKAAMQVSVRPRYTGLSLLDALRLFCSYSGKPVPLLYHTASGDFAAQYAHQNMGPNPCPHSHWKIRFWCKLAEYLLHVSNIAATYCHGDIEHDMEEHNRREDPYTGWIEERAFSQFRESCRSSSLFLREAIQVTAGPLCVDRLISEDAWIKLVQRVRVNPIHTAEKSPVAIAEMASYDLCAAMQKGLGRNRMLDITYMGKFQEWLDVPHCIPQWHLYHYVSKLDEKQIRCALSCPDDMPVTQASKFAWKLCRMTTTTDKYSDCYKRFLRAGLLEAIDVSDAHCRDFGWGKVTWTRPTAMYGPHGRARYLLP